MRIVRHSGNSNSSTATTTAPRGSNSHHSMTVNRSSDRTVGVSGTDTLSPHEGINLASQPVPYTPPIVSSQSLLSPSTGKIFKT